MSAVADARLEPGFATSIADAFVGIGEWSLFSIRALTGIVSKHFRTSELVRMCSQVGVGSLAVVGITGTFIGMVLAVQAYGQFHQIGLDTSLGAVIHMSVVRELGPVLTAIMLAGRIGGAMAAHSWYPRCWACLCRFWRSRWALRSGSTY